MHSKTLISLRISFQNKCYYIMTLLQQDPMQNSRHWLKQYTFLDKLQFTYINSLHNNMMGTTLKNPWSNLFSHFPRYTKLLVAVLNCYFFTTESFSSFSFYIYLHFLNVVFKAYLQYLMFSLIERKCNDISSLPFSLVFNAKFICGEQ